MNDKPKGGRPPGADSTCSFCGDCGHNATNGVCSRVAIATRMVDDTGCTASDAARAVGVDRSAVSERLRRLRLRSA
jgi:hypothetical protein